MYYCILNNEYGIPVEVYYGGAMPLPWREVLIAL